MTIIIFGTTKEKCGYSYCSNLANYIYVPGSAAYRAVARDMTEAVSKKRVVTGAMSLF